MAPRRKVIDIHKVRGPLEGVLLSRYQATLSAMTIDELLAAAGEMASTPPEKKAAPSEESSKPARRRRRKRSTAPPPDDVDADVDEVSMPDPT